MGGGKTGRIVKAVATGGLSEVRRAAKKLTEIPDLPKLPEPEPLPEPPEAGDKEVEAAKKKERRLSRLRTGRQSTILSNLRKELSPAGQAGGEQLG